MVDGELIVLDFSYLEGLRESIYYKDRVLTDDEIKKIQILIDTVVIQHIISDTHFHIKSVESLK